MGAIGHGGRGIEQDEQLGIGLAAIALEEAAVGAGEDVPVDVAQVVAFGVGTVLGEFLGEAEVGRAVEAGDEAVYDGLGNQVEAGDGCEGGGVKEALEHLFHRRGAGMPGVLTFGQSDVIEVHQGTGRSVGGPQVRELTPVQIDRCLR